MTQKQKLQEMINRRVQAVQDDAGQGSADQDGCKGGAQGNVCNGGVPEADCVGRCATVERKTKETDITVELNLDGTGKTCIDTGVPFFDHMLDAFGRHGLFDLNVRAKGDIEVDAHHTVEDVGIVLGTAFLQALGTKEGITRYGNFTLAMDEALVLAALDFSGRGGCWTEMNIPAEQVGNFDTELGVEFFKAFASNANLTLHVRQIAGENSHHILEAAFKALARALKDACEIDPRIAGVVPSTKGAL